jgi:NAD(P)H-dependent FMN reductase
MLSRPSMEPTVRILAISGSLRKASNTSVLQAMALLAPQGVAVESFDGLADLPAFNPDLDDAAGFSAVRDFRARIAAADGVLISSPEYAHGVPGALKNALDWLVGSGELVGKPVALINPSPRSLFAHPQLAEILTVMSADLVASASITIFVSGRGLDSAGIAADPELAAGLRQALFDLVSAIHARGRPA